MCLLHAFDKKIVHTFIYLHSRNWWARIQFNHFKQIRENGYLSFNLRVATLPKCSKKSYRAAKEQEKF